VLHERVVFMSILNEEIPSVAESERLVVRDLGNGFLQVIVHYGFMEQPDVMGVIGSLSELVGDGPWRQVKPMETTFYLGRETLLASGTSSLAHWRKRLFILMSRNSVTASAFFGLPANRVVELGAQIEL
jgi:KUP system potassium uptake protein